jgi:hypothetical protein
MREFRNATVTNHGSGMSDAFIDSIHGSYRTRTGPSEVYTDGANGVSSLVRTNKQSQTLQNEFDTVRGNKDMYVGGDFTIRVDGRLNFIAGNADKKAPIQQQWMDATADLAAARAAGEVKRGFSPIGFESVVEPRAGSFAKNPTLLSKFPSVNSTSQGLEAQGTSFTSKRTAGDSGTRVWATATGDTPAKSPSTQGGKFQPNEVDMPQLMAETQKKLTPIEREMPRNDMPLIADNFVFATTGPPNSRPPGRVDPIGRAERKGIKIFEKGPGTEYVGVPHIEEVDNYSDVPFGNFVFKAGNNFTIESGNGGINIMTGGGIKMVGNSNTIIGGKQILIAGTSNVRLKGGAFLGIEAANIDFKSASPITMDNLAVANGLVVGGGAYINGELFINHITAPKELQKTLVEPEVTYGNVVAGAVIGTCNGSPVYGIANPNTIQVNNHRHWFENLPLTLAGSNSGMRSAAAALNNGGVVGASAPTDAS